MSKAPKSLVQRAREAIVAASLKASPWTDIGTMTSAEIEVFAEKVESASSDLNGAAHRLRRHAKQLKKSGAAGAVHEPK